MQTLQLTARWINASPDYQMKNYIPKNTETCFDNEFVNKESREELKFMTSMLTFSRRTLKSSNHGANRLRKPETKESLNKNKQTSESRNRNHILSCNTKK